MKKKITLILILIVIFLTACNINNTPNSKVEEFLGKYQSLDSSINIQASSLATNSNLDKNTEQRYKKVIENQYKNLAYEIKDEKIDGDKATITTEIKVTDYKSIYEKYTPNNYTVEEYDKLVIDDLEKAKAKITYTIDFGLTKDNKGNWHVDDLTTEQTNKLLGIY